MTNERFDCDVCKNRGTMCGRCETNPLPDGRPSWWEATEHALNDMEYDAVRQPVDYDCGGY